MKGFTAADMSTAAANGHAEGYQAGYADAVKAVEAGKDAAGQEAVALIENARAATDFSTNYATAKPDIGNTEAEHILGLCRVVTGLISHIEAAPVAAAPVDGLPWLEHPETVEAKRQWNDVAAALGVDGDDVDAVLVTAKLAGIPAAPGVVQTYFVNLMDILRDEYNEYVNLKINAPLNLIHEALISALNAYADVRATLIARADASPKGVHAAPRFELTNGQIAQLADFAGTPATGTPLEDQDVLVIQHTDAGHSGPGLYAHYDELPEEGAIYLDGQLPVGPEGGSAEGVRVKQNCPPPSWMFPEDEAAPADSVTDWRVKAAAWLEEQATEQENTNKAYPAHVAAYPSWADRVHWLRTLASKVSESQATSAEVGA